MHTENAGEENAFIILEHDVRKAFRRVNSRKAAGPDSITGRVLKACAHQLAPVFTEIFNLSLEQSMILTCFKQSTIVPVPKKPQPACLNDYHSVVLTSVVMKCFERLVRNFITSSLPDTLDPLQFAYRPNHSTEDAIAHLHHTALSHLDSRKGNYVKMLFVDYSSAFNTIIPSILTTKLEILGLSLCRWISNLLTDRPQAVCVGKHVSPSLTHCVATSSSTNIIEFADDTAVVGLISNNDKTAYLEEIKNLETWCQDNNLLLNISKTELIVDFSTKQERNYHLPSGESGQFLVPRRLKDFKVPSKVLKTFYTCTIESILTRSITAWFGNSTKQDRQALQRVVRSAECTIRTMVPDLETI
ncbi:hypothetical protein QTP86_009402 [Hemibagrus guttatus]|nr:hypothetical protein QTP86_009402 [Hemibagrus guttatus]